MSKRSPLPSLLLILFLDGVGCGLMIPLMPYLATKYGASAVQMGLLLGVHPLLQFVLSKYWGRLSDRIGRRPLLLMSIAGAALSHLTFAFAASYPMLVFARMLSGAFTANTATAIAYITDITSPKSRVKGMGWMGMAMGLGIAIGPLWGSVLGRFSLQLPALGAAFLCAVNFAFAWWQLDEPRATHRKKLVPAPAPYRVTGMRSLLAQSFLIFLALAQLETSFFLFLKDRYGLAMSDASYTFGYGAFLLVVTQGLIVPGLVARFGSRVSPRLLMAGLAAMGTGLLGLPLVSHFGGLLCMITFIYLGSGAVLPCLLGSISLQCPDSQQGEVFGVNQSLKAFGRSTGPLMSGFLYGHWGPATPFWFASLLIFAGLTLAGLDFRSSAAKLPLSPFFSKRTAP